MIRCINIDWLEVYCLESISEPRDAEYYRAQQYKVDVRAYGTPQYREMFTVYDGDEPFCEIRRDPYSIKGQGGIFDARACHIRLVNRACYRPYPIDDLRAFLLAHGYEYKCVSRIDIALDFTVFDNGEYPSNFVLQYMSGKFAKVNQSAMAAHGFDTWTGRNFNSIKWGAASSPITTKLYNKSMELRRVQDKPYIRDAWRAAGLDESGRDVWRIEFALTAQMQSQRAKRTGEYKRKNLSDYDTREKLWLQFVALYAKYFDFRQVEYTTGKDGAVVLRRKYDCARAVLVKYSPNDVPFEPARNQTERPRPNRTLKVVANTIYRIATDPHTPKQVATSTITVYAWLSRMFSTEELLILQNEIAQSPSAPWLSKLDARSKRRRDRRLLQRLLSDHGYILPSDDAKRLHLLKEEAAFYTQPAFMSGYDYFDQTPF